MAALALSARSCRAALEDAAARAPSSARRWLSSSSWSAVPASSSFGQKMKSNVSLCTDPKSDSHASSSSSSVRRFTEGGIGARRGYATYAMSCGNGDYGRLGHGGAGQGDAGMGLSSETFRRVTGIPQVWHTFEWGFWGQKLVVRS